MNLIVDVGNTFIKFGVFEGDNLIFKNRFESESFINEYKNLKQSFPKLRNAIISSVGRLNNHLLHSIMNDFKAVILTSETNLPFNNNYASPKTLGVDRLALVSASVKHFSDKNVLIIDAGTCITYDFITNENNYLGGAISPGVRLRYKSLNNLTANLPLLDTQLPLDLIGINTEQSIHSGVVNGIIYEIDSIIDQYQSKYPDLTVILTGGDANFLSNQLKNSIFANSDFLLEGLNYILEFNIK